MSDVFAELRTLAVGDNYEEFLRFWAGCAKAFVNAYVVNEPAYMGSFYKELAVVLDETMKTNMDYRTRFVNV